MLATKEMARKAVAGELSIDPSRGKSGAIGPCRVLLRRNLHTIGVSLDGTTIGDALLTLDYCVATTNGARETLSRCDGASAPRKTSRPRLAGSTSRRGKLSARQLHPQCSSQLECDKSQKK